MFSFDRGSLPFYRALNDHRNVSFLIDVKKESYAFRWQRTISASIKCQHQSAASNFHRKPNQGKQADRFY